MRLAALAGDFSGSGIGRHIADSDFVNYWMGPLLALGGEVDLLFDPPAYEARLEELFGPDYPPHNWSYPPHALLLLWPLGLTGYKAAMAAFLAVTLAAYVLAALAFRRKFMPQAPEGIMLAALLPFILMNLAATQNGYLTGALLLGFLVTRGERPALAGIFLALLTTKPQLGILIPVLLIADRQWQTIGWGVFFTLLLLALSVTAFGLEPWHAYFEVIMPFQVEVMTTWEGVMLVMMPTVMSGLRLLGAEAGVAQSFQTAFSLACLPALVWLIWRLRGPHGDPAISAFALTAGTFLLTPYSFTYDMGALAAVSAALLARMAATGINGFAATATVLALMLAALLPLMTMLLGVIHLPVTPLLIALFLWVIVVRAPFKAVRPVAPA